jgi:hypothetical protein
MKPRRSKFRFRLWFRYAQACPDPIWVIPQGGATQPGGFVKIDLYYFKEE